MNWNIFHLKTLLLNYDILLTEFGYIPRSGFEKNLCNDPFISYAAVFLCHAELHRFGVRTGWLSLSVLSSYRFLQLLENFTLFEERTKDIVQLLEFVFEDSEYMENLENMLRSLYRLSVHVEIRLTSLTNVL